MENTHVDQPSLRATLAPVPGLADCNLQGETKSLCDFGKNP